MSDPLSIEQVLLLAMTKPGMWIDPYGVADFSGNGPQHFPQVIYGEVANCFTIDPDPDAPMRDNLTYEEVQMLWPRIEPEEYP